MWMLIDCFKSMTHHERGVKLKCKQLHLDCTKLFFTNVIVREWNKLPPSVVQCNMTNSFKNKLDHHLLQQGLR